MGKNVDRRHFLKLAACGAAGLLSGPACSSRRGPTPLRQRPDSLPNIVLILADDLGWGDVGYHGAEVATPFIDGLARDGVELDRFYSCPICSPTRAGLLTGRYPIRFGLQRRAVKAWEGRGIPLEEDLLPEMLARAGYARRAMTGKWHLGHSSRLHHPLSHGFTRFYGHYGGAVDYFSHESRGRLDWHEQFDPSFDQGYATDLIGGEAVRFIEESAGPEPFFLYVPFNAIHTKNQAPQSWIDRCSGINDPERRIKAAMIRCLDDNVGRILDALDRMKIAENSLVIFLSDNGGDLAYGSSNGLLRGGKHDVYEGGIRTPAAVRWPRGIEGGRRIESPLSYIDIYPTLRRIVGLHEICGTGRDLDGDDVLDLLRGGGSRIGWEFHSYIQEWSSDMTETDRELNALNTDEWKLVRRGPVWSATGDLRDHAEISLFRISRDPLEQEDLAADHPPIVDSMLGKIVAFRALQRPGLEPVTLEPPEGWSAPESWNIPDA